MLCLLYVLEVFKSYTYARPRPQDAARERDTPHADVFVKTTDRCGIPSRNQQQRRAHQSNPLHPVATLSCAIYDSGGDSNLL